jgi:hypothetical protein
MIARCRSLNNQAATFYHHGDVIAAYRTASAALALVFHFLSNYDAVDCNPNYNNHCVRIRENKICNDKVAYSVFPKTPCNVEAFNMIYQGAFVFTDEIPVDAQKTAAVILYNLALFQQVIGLHCGKMKYHTSSLQLYYKCLSLLDEPTDISECHSTIDRSASLQIMKAATYVNMMQIQENHTIETTHATTNITTCFQNTVKLFLSRSDIWTFISSNDKQFFALTMYMTTNANSMIRSAPAA